MVNRSVSTPLFLSGWMILLVSTGCHAQPDPVGLWRFNSSAPLKATVGQDLVANSPLTSIAGITPNDSAVNITTNVNWLSCFHGVPVDGANKSTLANAFSILIDFRLPAGNTTNIPLFEFSPEYGGAAETYIRGDNTIGNNSWGFTSDQVTPGVWNRLIITYSIDTSNNFQYKYLGVPRLRVSTYYLNGVNIKSQIWSFVVYMSVAGGVEHMQNKRYSLTPNNRFILFGDDSSPDSQIEVSTLAVYKEALSNEEVAALGTADSPVTLSTPPESDVTHANSVSDLSSITNGLYDVLKVENIPGVSDGLSLVNAVVNNGEITSFESGTCLFLGQILEVKDLTPIPNGLRGTCVFKVPDILGGQEEDLVIDFLNSGAVLVSGGHIEIPDIKIKGAFELTDAYLDIYPDTGTYGGGGSMKLDDWDKTITGSLELKSDIGPELFGHKTVDVTEFGMSVDGLHIAIGSTGAFLEEIGGKIEDEGGLSHPDTWLKSDFTGDFRIEMGPEIELLGKTIVAYSFNGSGTWNPWHGTFSFLGEAKLLNLITTTTVKLNYAPPLDIDAEADFSYYDIYVGSLSIHVTTSQFSGELSGAMKIPSWVPVVGGHTLASCDAGLDNTVIHGRADIDLTPRIPEVCVPEYCLPQVCGTIYYPSWCSKWWGGYPCIGSSYVCTPGVCTPAFCTPEVPALQAHFGFKFDMNNGDLSWETKDCEHQAWESPYNKAFKMDDQDSGTIRFMTNWNRLEIVSTEPLKGQKSFNQKSSKGEPVVSFTLSDPVPGLIFRLNYENGDVDSVSMTLRTPAGADLNSGTGTLPYGYSSVTGYSRFNAAGKEQAFVLLNPATGTYTATLHDETGLGNYIIEALVEDALPSGRIISITETTDPDQILITWEDQDEEGIPGVRIFLEHDSTSAHGTQVAYISAEDNVGYYILDVTALHVQAGDYFVRLALDDGVNAPFSLFSHQSVTIEPVGAPEPVSNIRYMPGEGGFIISWDPSPSENLLGYFVKYRLDTESKGPFDRKEFVPVDNPYGTLAVISGLQNGYPVLVEVVAVGENFMQSLPSEVLRITPWAEGAQHDPYITSTPDADAVVGYNYIYLPTLNDVDHESDDSYTWSLATGPSGMTIDASSGLVQWIPTVDQVGPNDVVLQLDEIHDSGINEVTQAFSVLVYGGDEGSGHEPSLIRFITNPFVSAKEGNLYEYQARVIASCDVTFELLEGPEEMQIDSSTGLLSWAVPAGAFGGWVRIMASCNGNTIKQEYFLFVRRADQEIISTPTSSSSSFDVWPIGVGDGVIDERDLIELLELTSKGEREEYEFMDFSSHWEK